MKIPLANQLKKQSQVEICMLQDELIRIVYSLSDEPVLHGGSSVWRCYSGKRFSEDLDFYSQTFLNRQESFKNMIRSAGLSLTKLKDTGNVVFSLVTNGRIEVRLKVNHATEVDGIPVKYELSDGTYAEVRSLSPNQLILEKISAYTDRRFIRDLYDIYHLSSVSEDLSPIIEDLSNFLQNIEKPVDEDVLKSLVFVGNPPSYERILTELRRITR